MLWLMPAKRMVRAGGRRVMCLDGSDECLLRSIRPDDQPLRDAKRAVVVERRRFGYRRIHVMLRRQGIEMNLKKLRQPCREEKLQARKRGGRKRALGTRRPIGVPNGANERWSLDLSAMPSPMVAGSAFWPWSATTRGMPGPCG